MEKATGDLMGLVFEPGSAFAQCHASSVAALAADRMVVAFFAGSHERHPDTAIWMAEGDGDRWAAPRSVFKISDLPHWNPILFADPEGLLHCWFKTGPDCARWVSWHACSSDGGKSWSVPEAVQHGDLPRGPVRCPPIILADGAWLAGASDELTPNEQGYRWWPFIDRSEDGGVSWVAHRIRLEEGAPAGKGCIQPTLWESAPGQVHCLLRSTLGAIYRADSSDGMNWTRAYRTALPNNNSGIVVARLANGVLAMAWNPVAQGRTPLRLSLSHNNGLTWTRHRELACGDGEFSYPALIVVGDELVATWTDRRTSIACWRGTSTDCTDEQEIRA
jgi:predicted neuraminidase